MGIDYTPSFVNYTGQGKFRFWCQSVLPLVYDDSLSYMELLNKMVIYLNNTIQDVAAVETNVDSLLAAYNQLQKYVNDYFDNLDVQDEINIKLDGLVEDGTMSELIQPFIDADLPGLVETNLPGVVEDQIPGVVAEQIDGAVSEQIGDVVAEQIPEKVTDWLDDNVTPVGSAVVVDSSLSVSGAAADAKVVGDRFADVNGSITRIYSNMYDEFNISDFTWEYGNINNTNGKDSSTGEDEHTRVRTSNFIKGAKDAVITINNAADSRLRIFVVRYNAPLQIDTAFIETSPTIRTTSPTYIIPSDCYIRIFGFYSDNTTQFSSENYLASLLTISNNYFFLPITTVDSELNENSENPVQNKKITEVVTALNEDIEEVQREIADTGYPSYYDEEVEAVISTVREKNSLSSLGDAFIFSTDHHYQNAENTANTDNAGYTMQLSKAVSEKTNNKLFISGGDILTRNHTKSEALNLLWNFSNKASKYFSNQYRILLGNHDDNHVQYDTSLIESRTLSEAEIYATMVKGYENSIVSDGMLHYYWDNINQKIRYVVLNTGTGVNMSYNDQYNWLNNVITNSPAGYRIFIFAHGIFTSYTDDTTYSISTTMGYMLQMCDAFNTRGVYSRGDYNFDYSSVNNKMIIGVICGHTHTDGGIYYGTSNIPIIVCSMDAYPISGSTAGTINEHAIDFANLDFTNNKIYLTRLGRNGITNRTRTFDIVSMV